VENLGPCGKSSDPRKGDESRHKSIMGLRKAPPLKTISVLTGLVQRTGPSKIRKTEKQNPQLNPHNGKGRGGFQQMGIGNERNKQQNGWRARMVVGWGWGGQFASRCATRGLRGPGKGRHLDGLKTPTMAGVKKMGIYRKTYHNTLTHWVR